MNGKKPTIEDYMLNFETLMNEYLSAMQKDLNMNSDTAIGMCISHLIDRLLERYDEEIIFEIMKKITKATIKNRG